MSCNDIPLTRFRQVRDELRDYDLPVTASNIARKLRVNRAPIARLMKRMPWLRNELGVVRGRRNDDGLLYEAYYAAFEQVERTHMIVSPHAIADVLGKKCNTVQAFIRRNPHFTHRFAYCHDEREARMQRAIRSLPRARRTRANIAVRFYEMHGYGSYKSICEYLSSHKRLVWRYGVYSEVSTRN